MNIIIISIFNEYFQPQIKLNNFIFELLEIFLAFKYEYEKRKN